MEAVQDLLMPEAESSNSGVLTTGRRNWQERIGFLIIGLLVGTGLMSLPYCSADSGPPTPDSAGPDEPDAAQWTCSMHPQVKQDQAGSCPLCGMDLIPVPQQQSPEESESHEVTLSKRAMNFAQLRTERVERAAHGTAKLRLLGRFEANETTLKTVTAWTGGRIDRLYANTTGTRVRAGQVIADIYSPEIFTAQQDLIVAKRQLRRSLQSPPSTQRAAQAALEAARERLRLLGVPQKALDKMEASKRPAHSVSIRSPFSGTVLERFATEGAYVRTGTPLHKIASLRTLWLQLDAYESDLPRLSLRQKVQIKVDAHPSEEYEGKVTFIEPVVDASRRTAKIRVQVDNRKGQLSPGMFAQATVLADDMSEEQGQLLISATAPLFTGRRSIVYVQVERNGWLHYESRTVRLGPRLGNKYPVVSGLKEGERVVKKGAFVLDADLQIHGGSSMMNAGQIHKTREQGTPVLNLSANERATLAPLISAYLEIQASLAADDLQAAVRSSEEAQAAAGKVTLSSDTARTAWKVLSSGLLESNRILGSSSTIEQARAAFEPMSSAAIELLTHFPNPLEHPVYLASCPMAAGSKGAFWLQSTSQIANPYFGPSMLECGDVHQKVVANGHLQSD